MFYKEIRIKQRLLHVILLIKDSLKQQIHFNGNIFGNKSCCRYNKGGGGILFETLRQSLENSNHLEEWIHFQGRQLCQNKIVSDSF